MTTVIQPSTGSCAENSPGDQNRHNPRDDRLFEAVTAVPVMAGPGMAPNRFHQGPDGSGMTNALPQMRTKFFYRSVIAHPEDLTQTGARSVDVIGDALEPGARIHVVHAGHRSARDLDETADTYSDRLDAAFVTPSAMA